MYSTNKIWWCKKQRRIVNKGIYGTFNSHCTSTCVKSKSITWSCSHMLNLTIYNTSNKNFERGLKVSSKYALSWNQNQQSVGKSQVNSKLWFYSQAASSTDSSLARIPPILLKDGICIPYFSSSFLILLISSSEKEQQQQQTTSKKDTEMEAGMNIFTSRNVFTPRPLSQKREAYFSE